MSRTRLLLVSMYPLDAGVWGPTARITRKAGALGWDEAILSVIEPTLQKARRCR